MKVLVVVNDERELASSLASQAHQWLTERGHQFEQISAREVVLSNLDRVALSERDQVGLVLSLGGDGTMLRALQLGVSSAAPVIGVNVGRLGFLAQVEPASMTEALDRFFASQLALESRMTLAVGVARSSGARMATAINEAVVERAEPGRTITFDVVINSEKFATFTADGIIVSTPTGSTGYNLSAGGPVASPTEDLLLVTPIAPHSLFDRTLVLDSNSEVELRVLTDRDAVVSVDGQVIDQVGTGESVSVSSGPGRAQYLRFDGRSFHRLLQEKLGLVGSPAQAGEAQHLPS